MIKILYLLIVMGFFSFFSMNNTFGMEVITKKEEKLNQAKKKELNYDDLVSNEIKFDNSKATRYFVGETKQQRNDGKLNNSLPVVVGDDVEKQKKAVEFAKSITPLVADKVLFFAKKYLELNKENPVFKNMTLEEYVERIY